METALNEYAIRFFLFLQEAFKMTAKEQLDRVLASSVPYMDAKDRKAYIAQLKSADREIPDPDDYSALEILKKELGNV